MSTEPGQDQTYVEVVYYEDPFSTLEESYRELIDGAESAKSYEVLDEVVLALEVALARAWVTRDCAQIGTLAFLLRDAAVTAAKLGGKFGDLLTIPAVRLRHTIKRLDERDCLPQADEVIEALAEVVANGFRADLHQTHGERAGGEMLEWLLECRREAVIAASTEIYGRGHYMYIPEDARRRFLREVQEQLGDTLGYTGFIALTPEDSEGNNESQDDDSEPRDR